MPGVRIAQLANFVGAASGGMKTALAELGRGYVDAGVDRLLVIPGPADAITETEDGIVVQVRAPHVGSGYRLIVEPWRLVDILERFAPTSIEWNDKLTLLPVAWWARRAGVRSVCLSHEQLTDMFAKRSGKPTTSKVSIGVVNRLVVRSFDTLVVTSRYAQHEFQRVADAAGCPIERVPLGVDLATFRPHPVHAAPTTGSCDSSTSAGSPARSHRTWPSPRQSSCTGAASPSGWTCTARARTSTSCRRSPGGRRSSSTGSSTAGRS